MPKKDPWIYTKRRKIKNKKKIQNKEAEPVENSRVSDGFVKIETLNCEILQVPLKQEIFYPDVRFQCSTTLFPSKGIENAINSVEPIETFTHNSGGDNFANLSEKGLFDYSGLQGKENELSEVFYSKDTSTAIEVKSEIPVANDNPLRIEETYSLTTPFPSKRIVDAINLEEPSKTFTYSSDDDTFSNPSKKCRFNDFELAVKYGEHSQLFYSEDTSTSIEVMSEIPVANDNPLKIEEIYSLTMNQTTSKFDSAEEIENIEPPETLRENFNRRPGYNDFATLPKNCFRDNSTIPDDCILIENPKSQPQVDIIDLTSNSQRIFSSFITLE